MATTMTEYLVRKVNVTKYSRLSAELQGTESRVNIASVEATEPMLPEYSETKMRIADIEARLRVIAVENPELFPDEKKTHKTPFGSISFRAVTYMDIDKEDEETLVLKVKDACHREILLAMREKRAPRLQVEKLIRTREALNIEALELFSDEELKHLFGIERKREEKFSVKPLEVKADKLAKKLSGSASATGRSTVAKEDHSRN